jgi:hypothetical protein
MILVAYATGALMGFAIGLVVAIRKNIEPGTYPIRSHRRTRDSSNGWSTVRKDYDRDTLVLGGAWDESHPGRR